VRVRAHPPHHPRRRRAARLQPEHPHPLLPCGGGGEGGRISTAVATSRRRETNARGKVGVQFTEWAAFWSALRKHLGLPVARPSPVHLIASPATFFFKKHNLLS
jgi:hypothetical protein